jgi:hypothetical protein
MELSKGAHILRVFIFVFSFVRINLLNFNLKKKGLNSEINNMAIATDSFV